MSQFTEPVEKLFQDSKIYLDKQLDNVKLRTVKGLSEGTTAIGALLVILALAGVFLLTLSFGVVMLIGELLGSYALGAFIVAGVLLVLAVILLLLRGRLFKNTFVSLYSGIITPGRTEADIQSLDTAIAETEGDIRVQEETLRQNLEQARNFYTPSHLFNEGLRLTGESAGRMGFGVGSVVSTLWRLFKGRKEKRKRLPAGK